MQPSERILLGIATAFVVAAATALVVAPAARAGAWSVANNPSPLLIVPLWAGCAAAALWAVRRWLPRHDPVLLPAVYLLAGWGIVLIWRLLPEFGLRQALWLVAGTAAMLGIMLLPGDLRWLRRYRYTWLAAGLILTALTLIMGVNPSGSASICGWGAAAFIFSRRKF
jgi:hypothetical protein